MTVIDLFRTFRTQEQAVEYLERVRWDGKPQCPYCASATVGTHASGDRKLPRWQCRTCGRAFSVTVGTVFQGTHIPLRSWLLVLAAMTKNSKRPASAYQIARDIGIRRPTVSNMMQRIRGALDTGTNTDVLLQRLIKPEPESLDITESKA